MADAASTKSIRSMTRTHTQTRANRQTRPPSYPSRCAAAVKHHKRASLNFPQEHMPTGDSSGGSSSNSCSVVVEQAAPKQLKT